MTGDGVVVRLVAARIRERSPTYTWMRDCGALRDHYYMDALLRTSDGDDQ